MVSGTFLRRSAAVALVLALATTPPAKADPGDVKGQDVMGDKTKSANDGWSQAPVPREESAGKNAADPGGTSMSNKSDDSSAKSSTKSSAESSSQNNGADDPQKPLDHRTPYPSGNNPAAPSK